MPKANKTQYAILGILTSGPKSGYDIKKYVDKSIGFFWNENFGHLYPILNRLTKEGLITKKTENQENKPKRHVYSITDNGRAALIDWLESQPDEQTIRNELLLQIFFGSLVNPQILKEKLHRLQEDHQRLLTSYAQVKKDIDAGCQDQEKEKKYWLITLQLGIMHSQMLVQWAEESLQLLDQADCL